MRAARTEYGRTHGELRSLGRSFGLFFNSEIFEYRAFYDFTAEFAVARRVSRSFAEYFNASLIYKKQSFLNYRVKLFYYKYGVNL